MSDALGWEFEIEQDGMIVAAGCGPDPISLEREANHYLSQYAQDGPCVMRFFREKPTKVCGCGDHFTGDGELCPICEED